MAACRVLFVLISINLGRTYLVPMRYGLGSCNLPSQFLGLRKIKARDAHALVMFVTVGDATAFTVHREFAPPTPSP